jgi:hypothetical protein
MSDDPGALRTVWFEDHPRSHLYRPIVDDHPEGVVRNEFNHLHRAIDRDAAMGAPAPNQGPDADRSTGQLLELHHRVPAWVVANMINGGELKDLPQRSVDEL